MNSACTTTHANGSGLIAHRRYHFYIIAFAVLLALPMLATGFFLDDYAHLMTLDGNSPVAEPYNIYCFAPGDPDKLLPLIADGPFPWFTDPGIHVEFFRPLSSASMWVDRQLFGKHAWPYHLHSILWYLALLTVVSALLRRSLPGFLGLLALALFAVDETHWFPVMWWSHRNSLVAATCAFAGLLAHLRWRQDGWKPGLPLSLFGLGLGLLGGETALSILGYFCAFELIAGPGNLARRLRALAPALLLGIGYLAFYTWNGFGVRGTDIYCNPMADPVLFLSKAPERLLILIATQFLSWPAELPAFLPAATWPSAILGVAVLALIGFVLRAIWPLLDERERRGVAWLGLGGLLALPPFLSAFTSGRLLLVSSLGGAAVIAAIVREAWRRRQFRSLGGVFIVLHLILAPLVWLALSPVFAYANGRIEQTVRDIEIDETHAAEKQFMVLNPSDPVLGPYEPAMRTEMGLSRPVVWRALSFAPYDHTLTRTGANSFELEVIGGEMLTTLPEAIARSGTNAFNKGETIHFAEFEVSIMDTGRVGPTRVRFKFRSQLDDARYVWLQSKNGGLSPFTMPAVGQRVVLEWSRIL